MQGVSPFLVEMSPFFNLNDHLRDRLTVTAVSDKNICPNPISCKSFGFFSLSQCEILTTVGSFYTAD